MNDFFLTLASVAVGYALRMAWESGVVFYSLLVKSQDESESSVGVQESKEAIK